MGRRDRLIDVLREWAEALETGEADPPLIWEMELWIARLVSELRRCV